MNDYEAGRLAGMREALDAMLANEQKRSSRPGLHRQLTEMTADRDEWKQQHELLVEVRRADLAALAAKHDTAPQALKAGDAPETVSEDVRMLDVLPLIQKEESREAWSLSYPDGMTVQQAANEVSDYAFLLEQVSKVYYHVTGGRLSKTNYYATEIISVHDELRQEEIDEALEEERQAVLGDRDQDPDDLSAAGDADALVKGEPT